MPAFSRAVSRTTLALFALGALRCGTNTQRNMEDVQSNRGDATAESAVGEGGADSATGDGASPDGVSPADGATPDGNAPDSAPPDGAAPDAPSADAQGADAPSSDAPGADASTMDATGTDAVVGVDARTTDVLGDILNLDSPPPDRVIMLADAGPDGMLGCTAGLLCGTTCVDPGTDVTNCGGCNVRCNSLPHTTGMGATCAGGRCQLAGACAVGYADCDGDPTNGCEANLFTNNSCGSCTTRCSSTQTCMTGAGGLPVCTDTGTCSGSTPNACGSTCTNFATDPNNCGSCGRFCAGAPVHSTPSCTAGTCGYTCDATWGDCDGMPTTGCETPVGFDVNNCGGCARRCTAGPNSSPLCVMGICQAQCQANYADCDRSAATGCEVALQSDPNNCGSCGTRCMAVPNASPVCITGFCNRACNTGFYDCDRVFANGCESSTPCP